MSQLPGIWGQWGGAYIPFIVAALVARMLVLPVGALQDVALVVRVLAVLCGVAGYFLARRNIAAGVGVGTAFIIAVDGLAR